MAYTGAGETVVVIDSGWSSGFTDAWRGDIVYQWDFADNDGDAQAPDAHSHGGAVASVVLSEAPEADIIHLKVFGDDSMGAWTSDIEEALQWVVANGAAYGVSVVNLSLGGGNEQTPQDTDRMSDEFADLADMGIVSVAAAGNDGDSYWFDGVGYPAADPNVLAVSASDAGGRATDWTQYHADLTDAFAWGERVPIETGSEALHWSGTSFSSPAVAGAIATLNQASTELRGVDVTLDEARSLIQATGSRIGESPGQVVLDSTALVDRFVDAVQTGTLEDLLNSAPGVDDSIPEPGERVVVEVPDNDSLWVDIIQGGSQDEYFTTARGDQDYYGNGGSDVFEFDGESGWDWIYDFDPGNDFLALGGLVADAVVGLDFWGDTTIKVGETEILLIGVGEEDWGDIRDIDHGAFLV